MIEIPEKINFGFGVFPYKLRMINNISADCGKVDRATVDCFPQSDWRQEKK